MTSFNILVAIDFSENSLSVLRKGMEAARERGGELYILHVVESSFFSKSVDIEVAKEHGRKKIKAEFPEFDLEHFFCVKGEVESEMGRFAEELNISLVMLGSSGEASAFERFFVGSHTKKIVRSLKVPTVVIKTQENVRYKNIFIPTDLSEESREHIKRVAELFPGAYLKLFHIFIMPFETRLGVYGFSQQEAHDFKNDLKINAQTEAERFVRGLGIDEDRVHLLVEKGELDTEFFIEEANRVGSNLIAVHTTGNISFFAFDLLEDADMDVLVCKIGG